jgi:hypothetical protein
VRAGEGLLMLCKNQVHDHKVLWSYDADGVKPCSSSFLSATSQICMNNYRAVFKNIIGQWGPISMDAVIIGG